MIKFTQIAFIFSLAPLSLGLPMFIFGCYLFAAVFHRKYYILVKTEKKIPQDSF